MKQLYLLRHAKSDWGDPGLRDHDRPLNARGQAAAARMGRYLLEAGINPDLTLCSSAVRTRETLASLQASSGLALPHQIEPRIYEAYHRTLLAVIQQQNNALQSLMMIGHNPGLQDLALTLLQGEAPTPEILALSGKYPTGALLVLDLDCERFSDAFEGCARLVSFTKPRDLMDED